MYRPEVGATRAGYNSTRVLGLVPLLRLGLGLGSGFGLGLGEKFYNVNDLGIEAGLTMV